MLAKKITYTDYNDNEREEVYYFNLSKAEIMEMELGVQGGMTKKIESMVAAEDGPGLASLYKEIILKAFGVKSPDGKRFIKSKELRDEFEQSEAYSELYIELVTDADRASEFINGIMPKQSLKLTEDHEKPGTLLG